MTGRIQRRWKTAAAVVAALAMAMLAACSGAPAGAQHGPAASGGSAGHGPAQPGHPPVIGGYYYHSPAMPVSAIPASRLTDVTYAFAGISPAGECYLPGGAPAAADAAAFGALKRSHPQLRTEISVGGWGAGGFSDAALTAQSRARLVSSCMQLFFGTYRGDFDGIDLDWEFPVDGGAAGVTSRPADRQDFTALIQDLRQALNSRGRQLGEHLLLTAALPAGRQQSAGPYDPASSYQLAAVGKVLDWVNLMTYNLQAGNSPVSGFDAPMHMLAADPAPSAVKRWNNVAAAVAYYEQEGVPAGKIVLGEPFFSLGYTLASTAGNGLYQKITGQASAPSWASICDSLLRNPAWTSHWSQAAAAPWLLNSATRTFITYDDPASLAVKSQFAQARHLRGVFSWAVDQDDTQHSLVNAMAGPFLQQAGLTASTGS